MYERYFQSVKGWQMAGWALTSGGALWEFLRSCGLPAHTSAIAALVASGVVGFVFLVNPKAREWAEANPPEVGGASEQMRDALKAAMRRAEDTKP